MCAAIVFWGTGVFRASAAASRKPSCHHLSGQAFQALTGKSLKNIIILIAIYRNAQMQAHPVEHEWTAKEIYSINPLPPSRLGLGQVTLRDRTVGGLACLGGLGGRPSTSRCSDSVGVGSCSHSTLVAWGGMRRSGTAPTATIAEFPQCILADKDRKKLKDRIMPQVLFSYVTWKINWDSMYSCTSLITHRYTMINNQWYIND